MSPPRIDDALKMIAVEVTRLETERDQAQSKVKFLLGELGWIAGFTSWWPSRVHERAKAAIQQSRGKP